MRTTEGQAMKCTARHWNQIGLKSSEHASSCMESSPLSEEWNVSIGTDLKGFARNVSDCRSNMHLPL